MSTDKQIIPPGIIRFKADTNFTCDHWPEIDGTYEEWVTRHFANPEYTIHQIQVNGVLYTVGDTIRHTFGEGKIASFEWLGKEWIVHTDDAPGRSSHIGIESVTKLTNPEDPRKLPNPEPIPIEQPPVSEGIKSAEEVWEKWREQPSGLGEFVSQQIIPAMEEYASQFKAPSPEQGIYTQDYIDKNYISKSEYNKIWDALRESQAMIYEMGKHIDESPSSTTQETTNEKA